MGIIQNALNQTINTAAFAARLSPGYEKKQALYESKQKMKGYKELAGSIEAKQGSITPEEAQVGEQLGNKIVSESEKRLYLDPTSENLAAHEQNLKANKELQENYKKYFGTMVTPADADEIIQEQAMLKAAEKQASKQTQKRNFKDYLGKLETSLGGTVSDLPKNVQSLIAKQYSSAERKSLMDKVDKESNK